MPELTEEEQALWDQHQPGKNVPGSPEPLDGACAAKLNGQNAGLRNLKIKTLRYCMNPKGFGTDHHGLGNCKYHLGATTKQELEAVRKQVLDRVEKRRALMENPPEMLHWTVELIDEARRAKGLVKVLDEDLLSRSTWWTSTTSGKEEEIALINTAREAKRDYVDLLKHISKLDLMNKQIELKQTHARAIAAVINKIVLDSTIGLTDEQVTIIRENLKREMKKISPLLEEDFKDFGVIDVEAVDEDVIS